MHAYLLALEIEPVMVNKVYVALPLHCTIMPWFRSNKTPAEVITALMPAMQGQSPLQLVSGPAGLFGNDKDVPVNRIVNDKELRSFHLRLYEALQTIGITDVESEWMQSGYVPHVTRQRSGRFEEGSSHIARKLYLAEAMIPDKLQQKKIITKLVLSGQERENKAK